MSQQSIDTFGVPEYWSDRLGAIEDAGHGMVRIVRCIERCGILIPVFTMITPALTFIQDEERRRKAAKKIAGMECGCN
jgi:hypothetical protein